VKIYVATMVALREKGVKKRMKLSLPQKKQGAFLSSPPLFPPGSPFNTNTLFGRFFLNLKLRVLVLCVHDFTRTSIVFDESLPTINKSKHPKKGGIQGIQTKKPCPSRTTKRGQTTRECQVPEPPSCCRKHIK
jgi:hypothetical protein